MSKIKIIATATTAGEAPLQATEGDPGSYSIAPKAGATLAIKATDEGGQDLSDAAWTKNTAPKEATELSSFTLDEGDYGSYEVTATVDGSEEKATLEITKPVAEPPQDGPDESSVAEIDLGEYDKGFSIATGIATLAVIAVIVLAAGWLINHTDWPDRTELASGKGVDGGYSEVTAAFVFIGAGSLAGIAIVAGLWMAALEVRGRLRAPITAPPVEGVVTRDATVELVKAVAEAVPKTLKMLTKARATIAALATGMLVLITVVICAAVVAGNGGAGPEAVNPSQSPSTSASTDEPSAEASTSGDPTQAVSPGSAESPTPTMPSPSD